ncbi:MAG: CBS domain-containing protein [Chloroflexota bacterium]|jgi:acetoin utilization protein AcuB
MLTVSDLMTSIPTSITPGSSLRTIIAVMKAAGCRQLPVLDQGKLVGIITDRDIRTVLNSPIVLHGRWQDEALLDKATAENAMTPDPVTVTPDTPAYRAAEMLSTYKFGALPVVDGDLVVGIITVTDFLNYIAKKGPRTVDGKR